MATHKQTTTSIISCIISLSSISSISSTSTSSGIGGISIGFCLSTANIQPTFQIHITVVQTQLIPSCCLCCVFVLFVFLCLLLFSLFFKCIYI